MQVRHRPPFHMRVACRSSDGPAGSVRTQNRAASFKGGSSTSRTYTLTHTFVWVRWKRRRATAGSQRRANPLRAITGFRTGACVRVLRWPGGLAGFWSGLRSPLRDVRTVRAKVDVAGSVLPVWPGSAIMIHTRPEGSARPQFAVRLDEARTALPTHLGRPATAAAPVCGVRGECYRLAGIAYITIIFSLLTLRHGLIVFEACAVAMSTGHAHSPTPTSSYMNQRGPFYNKRTTDRRVDITDYSFRAIDHLPFEPFTPLARGP